MFGSDADDRQTLSLAMPLTVNGDAAVARATSTTSSASAPTDIHWRDVVAPYQRTEVWRSLAQLAVTLGSLALCFAAMAFSLRGPYWGTLLLAVPTAGFLVRTFIVMHDCAHGSFLPWRRANDAIGFVTGVLTLTPFDQWRRDHALHHASSGDLDRRGSGDIETITVREYLDRTPSQRFWYRMSRNPVALLLVGPLWLIYNHRFHTRSRLHTAKQGASVLSTNVALAAIIIASFAFGILPEVAMIYLPSIYIAAAAGVFLFYVQHQFEDTYWQRHEGWDYLDASIAGSSYLKLPWPLAWLTGNIGVHHVHHISPKIPNYKLRQCHDENPLFHRVTTLTLKDTGKALRLSLWDEDQGRLISFRELSARASGTEARTRRPR